jgi:hypothetical protein
MSAPPDLRRPNRTGSETARLSAPQSSLMHRQMKNGTVGINSWSIGRRRVVEGGGDDDQSEVIPRPGNFQGARPLNLQSSVRDSPRSRPPKLTVNRSGRLWDSEVGLFVEFSDVTRPSGHGKRRGETGGAADCAS